MKSTEVVSALGALAQETRLHLYRELVKRGPSGYTPGELAGKLSIPAPTLSFHLKELSHAGLADAERDGRFLRYRAQYAQMDALMGFLTENCCAGSTTCSPRQRSKGACS